MSWAALSAHLPALVVVVPLVAAPLSLIAGRGVFAWAIAQAAALVSAAMAWTMLLRTSLAPSPEGAAVVYAMGGWPAPIGITYTVDALSAMVLTLVSTVAAVVFVYGRPSVEAELPPDRVALFWTAALLCLTGMLGMTATSDAFNVFVFLEISSLSSYVLVALGRSRQALVAAYRYLILGSLGGTFILIGIGLAYMLTGTLNMADLAARLPAVSTSRAVLVSFAFITVGASLKLALWPLHTWLPDAYATAPSTVSAFISATSTKVMVYVLARFAYGVYGQRFAFEELGLGSPLLALSLAGIWVASAAAIQQTDGKRLLAYSSVGQVGYMILGLSLATVPGVAAGLSHLVHHGLIKAGMFLALGAMSYRAGSARLSDLAGIGRRMPLSFAALVIGGLGLIGVPLTGGFTTKWALLGALWDEQRFVVAALVLASSLLAVAYVFKLVEAAWFRPLREELADVGEAPLSMLVPMWLLIGASVATGVQGSWTLGAATRGAEALMAAPSAVEAAP
jgi:multicomponent Na+:H+ antiporter subunit D